MEWNFKESKMYVMMLLCQCGIDQKPLMEIYHGAVLKIKRDNILINHYLVLAKVGNPQRSRTLFK